MRDERCGDAPIASVRLYLSNDDIEALERLLATEVVKRSGGLYEVPGVTIGSDGLRVRGTTYGPKTAIAIDYDRSNGDQGRAWFRVSELREGESLDDEGSYRDLASEAKC